jgi:hypothetical protein
MALWRGRYGPFRNLSVVAFVIDRCFEHRFIEDQLFVYFTSYISIELRRPTLSSRFQLCPAAIAIHFPFSLRCCPRDVELPEVDLMVGGGSILLEIAKMALIFAFGGIAFEVVPGEHLGHVEGLALAAECTTSYP